MGDRTYYELSLDYTDLNAELVAKIGVAFTEDDGFSVAEAQAHIDNEWTIDIEERYTGEAREAADAVLAVMDEAGTHAAFTVTESPKGDGLGTSVDYSPERGMHVADCDGGGNIVLNEHEITQAIESTSSREDLVARLRELIGA